ncbi:MAG: PaaI family thioesterase [Gammaproteobacteria bacterium]
MSFHAAESQGQCFQDFMPGAVCFGCGSSNAAGLQIRSFWDREEGVCVWQPDERHQGWAGITCGGIIATLIDCHCMATAMATAVRREDRALGTDPQYRFATARLDIGFLKPTPIDRALELRTRVVDVRDGRKFHLDCALSVAGVKTVEASVVAVLVYRSDDPQAHGAQFGLGATRAL